MKTYRKYHTISGDMNENMVESFREILNDKECIDHVVYFKSDGGFIDCADVIVSMIKHYNHPNSSKRCLIVVHDIVSSSAFNFCFLLPPSCIKYTSAVVGMVHKCANDITITGNGKHKNAMEKAKHDFLLFTHKEDLKLYKKIGLTRSEIKRIEDGEDLYLQNNDMVELFKRNGIKKFN